MRVAARAGAAPEGGSPEPPPPPAAVSSGLGVAGCRPRGPPPTLRELPGPPPEVAAVVAAPAEARSPGRGNLAASERTTTAAAAGPGYPGSPKAAATANHPPGARGATTKQAAGPGAKVWGSGARPLRLSAAPRPRAGLVRLPPSSGKGPPDVPLWASPVGQT